MAETTAAALKPNPKIGSIEYVGDDGFIVVSADPADPAFIGGKRLFNNSHRTDLARDLNARAAVDQEDGRATAAGRAANRRVEGFA